MYNGIGLATARGSGTNGYVQRNWAAIKKIKDQTSFKTEEELAKIDSSANRQPNQELLDHDRKRKVELKCIELEQSLEDQGYSQNEISEKINNFRVTLLGKQKPGTEYDEFGRPIVKDTHQFADEQLKKNARLRDAFGISEYFIEGSSLDPERKTKEAALAQLKRLQVDQAVVQTQMNDDTSTNKDSSITNELQFKSPKHKKRKKKKSKSHKAEKEKRSDKRKSKKHKRKHNSSSEDSSRDDEAKFNKTSSQVKSKCIDDKVTTENIKKKYESENNHKKYSKENDKTYKNNKKEVENKHKGDWEDYRKKDSKSDNSKNSKKDKYTEEIHKSKSKDIINESKRQDNSPKHKTPIKERDRDKDRDYDKYSHRHQRHRSDNKSNKEKHDKKSNKTDPKYSSKKRNQSLVKELKKPTFKPDKLTCIFDDTDSDKSCYTPPPKDMNAVHSKFSQSKINEEKSVKSTKYTFSLREDSEERLVVPSKTNGRSDDLKVALQNTSELQHKKSDSRKLNSQVDEIFLDSSSSEEGGLEGDINLNIIKEITTEKIKKVFELHEKQEQALLHLKKKLMEKKRKVRTSSSSSESSGEEPVKKKSIKRRHARDSSSSNSDGKIKKKSKRSRFSSSSSSASDTSVDRHKSSSKRRSLDKYSKKKSPVSRRRTKDSVSQSRSLSLSSIERSRKKRASSSEESSPRRKHKSSKHKRSSRRRRRSDSSSSSSSSISSPCYKKKSRYSSSRSRSTSSSSSSRYSRSSSSSHGSRSSVSSRSSKSRSASIPRRRGSPSFLDRRRITSARKRPIPYTRLTPFSTNSDTDSVISVHDSPFAESH